MIIHNYLAKNIDIFAAEIWNQVSPSVDNFKEGAVHKVTIKLLHSKKDKIIIFENILTCTFF